MPLISILAFSGLNSSPPSPSDPLIRGLPNPAFRGSEPSGPLPQPHSISGVLGRCDHLGPPETSYRCLDKELPSSQFAKDLVQWWPRPEVGAGCPGGIAGDPVEQLELVLVWKATV
jgi:hypothetical protein